MDDGLIYASMNILATSASAQSSYFNWIFSHDALSDSNGIEFQIGVWVLGFLLHLEVEMRERNIVQKSLLLNYDDGHYHRCTFYGTIVLFSNNVMHLMFHFLSFVPLYVHQYERCVSILFNKKRISIAI